MVIEFLLKPFLVRNASTSSSSVGAYLLKFWGVQPRRWLNKSPRYGNLCSGLGFSDRLHASSYSRRLTCCHVTLVATLLTRWRLAFPSNPSRSVFPAAACDRHYVVVRRFLPHWSGSPVHSIRTVFSPFPEEVPHFLCLLAFVIHAINSRFGHRTHTRTHVHYHRHHTRWNSVTYAHIDRIVLVYMIYIDARSLSKWQITLKPWLQLQFDYDTTKIRRCHDAFDYDGSDRNYDSTAIRPRQDYDEKIDMLIFCSRRTRRSQSHGSRRGTAYAADDDSWSAASALHDVIVYVTTNMDFMNDKEVEYLINLYQS